MSELTRRALIGGLAGGAAGGLAAGGAFAESDWPSRTITIIHGFAAGGPSDVVARVVADGLSKSLGQSVIVEPRPGASGTSAAAQIARAAPDGYTLGTIPAGHATAAATFAKLPFRAVDDFTMISLATNYPYVMAVNVESPIKSVAELIEAARARVRPRSCTARPAPVRARISPSNCLRCRRKSKCSTSPSRAASRPRPSLSPTVSIS